MRRSARLFAPWRAFCAPQIEHAATPRHATAPLRSMSIRQSISTRQERPETAFQRRRAAQRADRRRHHRYGGRVEHCQRYHVVARRAARYARDTRAFVKLFHRGKSIRRRRVARCRVYSRLCLPLFPRHRSPIAPHRETQRAKAGVIRRVRCLSTPAFLKSSIMPHHRHIVPHSVSDSFTAPEAPSSTAHESASARPVAIP